jgi:hypothetical protein
VHWRGSLVEADAMRGEDQRSEDIFNYVRMQQLVSSRCSKRAMLFVQPLGPEGFSRQWIDGFPKRLWQMWRSERKRSFATRRHRRFPQSNLVAKQAHNNGIRTNLTTHPPAYSRQVQGWQVPLPAPCDTC